ncbi:hypothetical protein GY45DRAFT_567164 [Cubamyces sp. BRFM 1775]|nr:hypothetical protein GY45DRAFT_567164 [Cubamyces sp. BRFM 1775]
MLQALGIQLLLRICNEQTQLHRQQMYSVVPPDIPLTGLSSLSLRADVLRLHFAASAPLTFVRSTLARAQNQNAVYQAMPAFMGPAYAADGGSLPAVLPMQEPRSWNRWIPPAARTSGHRCAVATLQFDRRCQRRALDGLMAPAAIQAWTWASPGEDVP